jgi:5'(3')-deoxyribonucleotidase
MKHEHWLRHHRKRVLSDVDGVCAKFHDKARVLIREMFGLDLPLEAYTKWDVTSVLPTQDMKDALNAAIAEPGFAITLEPYPEAQKAVVEIREIAPIRFVTTPHIVSRTWMQERREWLIDKFSAEHREIIQCHDKVEVTGGVFLDDKPSHVRNWQEHHPDGISLLWDQPYNRSPAESAGLRRVTSWDEVIEIVKKL